MLCAAQQSHVVHPEWQPCSMPPALLKHRLQCKPQVLARPTLGGHSIFQNSEWLMWPGMGCDEWMVV